MNLNQKCINVARVVSAEMISRANSGHTGVALGATTILYSLFKDHYTYYSQEYRNRDRLVLSAGHASALLYTLEYMFGFNVSLDDLKNFRKLGSKTPGHPEYGVTDGVEVSTGPLGQGVANAVGMAIAEAQLAEKFNAQKFNVINHKVYCFVGDGCLMEGVANEAISLAGTLKLKNLILLYDSNSITMDGKTNLANTEDVERKFKSQGWRVIKVSNGNSYFSCTNAIGQAKNSKKPCIIIFKTKIGYGTKYVGSNAIHGKPLNAEELQALKDNLFYEGDLSVPSEVREYCYRSHRRSKVNYFKWEKQFVLYQNTHPDLSKEFLEFFEIPHINFAKLCKGKFKEKNSMREANKVVINQIANHLKSFVGGTADVMNSTMAYIDDGGDFSAENYRGRNIHYGIREHAMVAIANGISLYFGLPSFVSTFLTFVNYCIAPIRMTAMMNIPVWAYLTHDSIYVGEDGPTHQPVEQIAQLRCIPNYTVFRPCCTTELLACHSIAYEQMRPCAFILSKQELEEQDVSFDDAKKGAYILAEDENADIIIFATGSEVSLALEAKAELNRMGKKLVLVSVPSVEVFERQSAKYKESILKRGIKKRVAVEASNDPVWYKFIGLEGLMFGVDKFGLSGKGSEVANYFGFNKQNLVEKIKNL